MKYEYKEWISEYLKNNDPRRKCKEATEAMNKCFPELNKVRGHVRCVLTDDLQPHWWLIDSGKNIIDPTASQFVIVSEYIPHDESRPEPTGKCPNCGGYCYEYKSVCSDKCAQEYLAYLNGCAGFR